MPTMYDHEAARKIEAFEDSMLGLKGLSKAIANNDVAQARRLIGKGADVNEVNTALGPPLKQAIIKFADSDRVLDMVTLLLSSGAHVNGTGGIMGSTGCPLHCAVGRGDRVMQLLLSHGAEVNATDSSGRTPLHIAAGGHPGSIRVLVEAGADVNAADDEERTPLHIAVAGRLESTQALLNAGADVNSVDKSGRTPLDIGREYECLPDILVSAGGIRGRRPWWQFW